MEGIRTERVGNASWIILDNPDANALYPALVSSLLDALHAVPTPIPTSKPWS